MQNTSENLRVDKWLWAARFFKTRSMATQAVNGGKVHMNGNRIKAARNVEIGDRLLITKGDLEFDITVVGLSKYRRPAAEARLLYEESPESVEKRRDNREMRKMFNATRISPAKKPDKRERRKIREFIRKG